jgi:hypothetical protein
VTVCGQKVGTIAAKAKAVRTCTAAQKTAKVDVLRPSLRATTTTEPMTALPGQVVKFSTTVSNIGNTPLFNLNARTATNGCTPMQGQLNPGATSTVDCTAPAGDESGTLTSTVTAADRIGGRAEASASVQVEVIYPRLTIERVTCTCQVTAPVNSRLTVSGAEAAGESALVRVEPLTVDAAPVAPRADEPVPPRPVANVEQVSKPAVGGVAAVMGVIGMVIVASAFSGLGRR